MIIDPDTMLIQNFQPAVRQEIWEGIQRLMRSNYVDEDGTITFLFLDWCHICNQTGDLLTMSTLFPMRVMESLILSGFVPAQT